ncbi:hypothetical protein MOS_512 [Mesomycoplasma hyorhinis SK76]|uniref:Lipoprotein n=1 Tax=Mesomycoplasma hyorhinis SK76 TaxID=1118964 RepID=A0AAI8AN41_MESHY|nr:hypothetical protein MOS_512 [Mesomycoplasma hyorhinis SK76]
MNRIKSKKFLGFLTALTIPAVSVITVSCGANNYSYKFSDNTITVNTVNHSVKYTVDGGKTAVFSLSMENIQPKFLMVLI